MAEPAEYNPKTIERIKEPLKSIFQHLTFTRGDVDFDDKDDFIIDHYKGFFFCKNSCVEKLKTRLQTKFPNISQKSIDERIRESAMIPLLDSFVEKQERDWATSFELGSCGAELATDAQLELVATKLLDDLKSLVRDYVISVPILGVSLTVASYDFGPVKIVRRKDSLQIPMTEQDSAGLPSIRHMESYFESIPCLVESSVSGDTNYARQEGLRLATQLAAILNLHLARWSLDDHLHQKIQCVGVPTLGTRVILARTNLPDASGAERQVYLQETKTRSILQHSLNTTQLNAIKQQGFDKIWKCFGESNELCKRIERSVSWYDKAANFYEIDAQFVGFTTALEILLVQGKDQSITQQLAERCAFLLGYDLESTIAKSDQVKDLYDLRSAIVHNGQEPTIDDVKNMSVLVSSMILKFVECDFQNYEQFETRIKHLKYSRNLAEVQFLLSK